jgi:polysaccharide biosynthesis/export protein
LRNRKPQGVLRSVLYLSGCTAFLLLLAASPAQSQTQKMPAVPASQATKPANLAVSQTNERIAQLVLASDIKQGDYTIGSGDLLGIDVFDIPELSRDARVNETGYISLPLLPSKVKASGLTPYQLQDKLAELLQTNGLVSTPQVTVMVKEQHSQPITVIGAVKTPMVIQAFRKTTLLQALSQAGGIGEDAGSTVVITRSAPESTTTTSPTSSTSDSSDLADDLPPVPAQTFTINLADLLESGDSRFDIPLVGGDVVSVPRAGIIYVVGAVQHPGGFLLQNDLDHMTMLKMLALAGGTTSVAKTNKTVILRRNLTTGQRDQVPIDLGKIMHLKSQDVQLEANDILFVPDSNSLKVLHKAGDIGIYLTEGLGWVGIGKL